MSSKTTTQFLNVDAPYNNPKTARFHVLPAPYEATVSYGGGTAHGPEAILQASSQVEFFDGISSPMQAGIFTRDALVFAGLSPVQSVDLIREGVAAIYKDSHIPVMLGGEHSVTLGAVQATAARYGDIGVVQFDAHSDLRDSYEGSIYSHACVMKRVVDLGIPLFQIGIRSMCASDVVLRREKNIGFLDGAELARNGIPKVLLPASFPKKVYLTFDIDGLDPSIVPATGTPEPGGLLWYQALDLIERVTHQCEVVGFDVVELAPNPQHHASDFITAKLVYAIMGSIVRNAK